MYEMRQLAMQAWMLSCISRVQLFATLWTVAGQAPLSVEFSRPENWSGLPCFPGDLPDPGIEPVSLTSPYAQAGSLPLTAPGKHSNLYRHLL